MTRYQWLVLTVASLGWVFDAFEGQIYNLTRADMLPALLHLEPGDPGVKVWGERFLGFFLAGGTFGGLLFSSLADRWGRGPTLAAVMASLGLSMALWLAADGYAALALFALWMGLSYGGAVSLMPALCMDLFGARRLVDHRHAVHRGGVGQPGRALGGRARVRRHRQLRTGGGRLRRARAGRGGCGAGGDPHAAASGAAGRGPARFLESRR